MGGTEILFENLKTVLGNEWNQNINLMLSTCRHEYIAENKINILWQQLSYDQQNVQLMRDQSFIDKVDYFIYGSNWQFEKFRYFFNIPENKSRVIKNAIRKIEFVPKQKKIGRTHV